MYSNIVVSLDKCFGLCDIDQSLGNGNFGWHRFVFPKYINWTGRKVPIAVPQNTAVICLLSVAPAMETHFEPSFSIVQEDTGTKHMM